MGAHMSRATYARVPSAPRRRLTRWIAQMRGQLGLKRAVQQPTRQVRKDPVGPGDLLRRAHARKQRVQQLVADLRPGLAHARTARQPRKHLSPLGGCRSRRSPRRLAPLPARTTQNITVETRRRRHDQSFRPHLHGSSDTPRCANDSSRGVCSGSRRSPAFASPPKPRSSSALTKISLVPMRCSSEPNRCWSRPRGFGPSRTGTWASGCWRQGSPTGERLLGAAIAFFASAGTQPPAEAARALLRAAGRPVPRRGRGHATVPAQLATAGISSREMDVLLLLAEGLTNRQIAARLYLSPRTVEKHVERLLAKTDSPNRVALSARAALHAAP